MDAAAFSISAVQGVTLTKWTRAWVERRPEDPLAVERVTPPDQLTALRSGAADIAFVRLPIDADGLNVIPLYEEQPVVVVPKDHHLDGAENVVLAGLEGENLVEGSFDERIALVAANVGVALVPQSIARLSARRDIVAIPVADAPTTRIALAWLDTAPVSAEGDPSAERTAHRIDEFIGIVRGRTARSSRATPTPPAEKPTKSRDAAADAKKGPRSSIRSRATPSATAARDAARRRKRGGR